MPTFAICLENSVSGTKLRTDGPKIIPTAMYATNSACRANNAIVARIAALVKIIKIEKIIDSEEETVMSIAMVSWSNH